MDLWVNLSTLNLRKASLKVFIIFKGTLNLSFSKQGRSNFPTEAEKADFPPEIKIVQGNISMKSEKMWKKEMSKTRLQEEQVSKIMSVVLGQES